MRNVGEDVLDLLERSAAELRLRDRVSNWIVVYWYSGGRVVFGADACVCDPLQLRTWQPWLSTAGIEGRVTYREYMMS